MRANINEKRKRIIALTGAALGDTYIQIFDITQLYERRLVDCRDRVARQVTACMNMSCDTTQRLDICASEA